MDIKTAFNWFLSQTSTNKVAVILIAVMCVMYVDRKDFKDELKNLKSDRKKIDSTYTARLNTLNRDYQKKIDDCNNERISDYVKQSQMWQAKFDDLFKETDVMYQKYQNAINKK